jgi:hypothetical protein
MDEVREMLWSAGLELFTIDYLLADNSDRWLQVSDREVIDTALDRVCPECESAFPRNGKALEPGLCDGNCTRCQKCGADETACDCAVYDDFDSDFAHECAHMPGRI